jgi:hypothetical protein
MLDGFEIKDIDESIYKRISGITLPEKAEVSPSDLKYLTVKHIGFDGEVHDGELICASSVAKELLEIFEELFESGYRIEKIRLADEYGGDDDKIMADNNSSCFNYRCVANTDTVSMHGYGKAVDINPLYNPYIQDGVVMPANAAPFADRTADFEHKITHEDVCYKIFRAHGWLWGGDWMNDVDYQHFFKPSSRMQKIIKYFIG